MCILFLRMSTNKEPILNTSFKEQFSNDCRETKTKAITPTNHDRGNSTMNQSQFPEITSNSLKTREKSRVHGAIGFGFASHWLKNWFESFNNH